MLNQHLARLPLSYQTDKKFIGGMYDLVLGRLREPGRRVFPLYRLTSTGKWEITVGRHGDSRKLSGNFRAKPPINFSYYFDLSLLNIIVIGL